MAGDGNSAIDRLLGAIATLEAQQREFGLDLTGQIGELRQRLAEMGGAAVTGSGAVATDDGVAAGAGGVAVRGNVHGNIYLGPKTDDPAEALRIYHQVLVSSCGQMSLRGLDPDASDPGGAQQSVDLARVYVNLLTTTQVPARQAGSARQGRRSIRQTRNRVRSSLDPFTLMADGETRPLPAVEAVARSRNAVLLGDPGSGKSTFVTYLTLCLTSRQLYPQQGWLDRLTGWPTREANAIPLLVTLRDFARSLPAVLPEATPAHLWNFIKSRLEAQNLEFVAGPLQQALDHEGRVLALLDGFDEVAERGQRTFVRDAIEVFARRYPKSRFVVTCRTLSYQDPAWQLPDFESYSLESFNEEQIDQFITAWHQELARLGSMGPQVAEAAGRQLKDAVRRPDLWRLASSPLLLTVMALVHTHRGRLPGSRALLYEETIDILLWRWEQIKVTGGDQGPLLQQLLDQAGRADVDLKRVLRQLAFEAHQGVGSEDAESVADIPELSLRKSLAALHSWDWANQLIEIMRLRAGLLLERDTGVYAFPHRTFQEYLAGGHLAAQPDFAAQAARLSAEGSLWREAVLLAVGQLVYVWADTAKPLNLVAELCPVPEVDSEAAWRQAWLAGDALLEIGLNRVNDTNLGQELLERVKRRLTDLLGKERLEPVERAAAGNTLGYLGDPRFRADAWQLPDGPLLGFVEIPAGPFLMGSDSERDRQAFDDESPQHEITLPRYYMARYPVTVDQFRAFVADSGYRPAREAGLNGLPNHPVVDVSWHDALAYSRWLTEKLRGWEGTPEPLAALLRREGWKISLPSEADWEKAARGTDGRVYPWEGDFDAGKANSSETGIDGTSAVGAFPSGASPYGCLDMAGNVWEWTRSLLGNYPYPSNEAERAQREDPEVGDEVSRVVRGGSFLANRQGLRCAVRGRYFPNFRFRGLGFRVAALP